MSIQDHSTAYALFNERAARLISEAAAHRLAREAGRPASKRTGLVAPPSTVRQLRRVARTGPDGPETVSPDAAVPALPVIPVETATEWLADRRAS